MCAISIIDGFYSISINHLIIRIIVFYLTNIKLYFQKIFHLLFKYIFLRVSQVNLGYCFQ